MLKWIDNRFGKGFYFPAFLRLLAVLEKLGINFWLKRFVKGRGFIVSGEKAPPWVSELYQFVFLSIGIVSLVLINEPLSTPSLWGVIVIVVLSYRLFDILVFTLNWIFVHSARVHLYRRSIAGFMINLIELGLYASVISILANCSVSSIDKYSLLYHHLKGIFAFDLPDPASCNGCQVLSCFELFTSVLLVLVVIAGLVGAILREEVDHKGDNN